MTDTGRRRMPLSADTGGQALGEEGHQLLAAGVRERLGAEHVVQDREPHELGQDHGGPDRSLVAADMLGEEPKLGRSRSRRNSSIARGSAAECNRSSNGVSSPVRCVLSAVHHDPGEVVRQVRPPVPEAAAPCRGRA